MVRKFVDWTRKFVDLRGASAIFMEENAIGRKEKRDMSKRKLCKDCSYFRQPMKSGMFTAKTWCSNSKSTHGASYMDLEEKACREFTKRDKKAPLWMRLLKKANNG